MAKVGRVLAGRLFTGTSWVAGQPPRTQATGQLATLTWTFAEASTVPVKVAGTTPELVNSTSVTVRPLRMCKLTVKVAGSAPEKVYAGRPTPNTPVRAT